MDLKGMRTPWSESRTGVSVAVEERHEVALFGERPVAVAGAEPVRHARSREGHDQVPPERPHRRLDSRPPREIEEVGLEELLSLAEGDHLGLERRAERQDERDRAPGAGEMARDRVARESRPPGEGDAGRGDHGDAEQAEPGGGAASSPARAAIARVASQTAAGASSRRRYRASRRTVHGSMASRSGRQGTT